MISRVGLRAGVPAIFPEGQRAVVPVAHRVADWVRVVRVVRVVRDFDHYDAETSLPSLSPSVSMHSKLTRQFR